MTQIKTADRANLKALVAPLVRRIRTLEGAVGEGLPTDIPDATVTRHGLMSAEDKIKVSCIGNTGFADPEQEFTAGSPDTYHKIATDIVNLFKFATIMDLDLIVGDGKSKFSEVSGLTFNKDSKSVCFEDGEELTIGSFATHLTGFNVSEGDPEWDTPFEGHPDYMNIISNFFEDSTTALFLAAIFLTGETGTVDLFANGTDECLMTYCTTTRLFSPVITTYTATREVNGLMSASDKTKLDGLPDLWFGTQSQYNAVTDKSDGTLYFIYK